MLSIPSLGLTAPVLAGVTSSSLDRGIGHLDSSRWPDQGGTDVLEAHDVTFFTHLPDLKPGQKIKLTAPCRSWTYTVTDGTVVHAGDPIPDDPEPTLVLVTCYPSNALYYTSRRYVITSALIATTAAPQQQTPTVQAEAIRPQLPAGLQYARRGPNTNRPPLGDLRLIDADDPNGYKSAGGLPASDAAVTLVSVARAAASNNRRDWWTTVAPTIPYGYRADLLGNDWTQPLNITVYADNGHITRVRMTGTLDTHQISIVATNNNRTLTLTNITSS